MNELHAINLSITLSSKPILRDVSIRLQAGQLIGILGCNGTGKSTLIRALLGYIPATQGRVLLNGQPLATYSDRQRASLVGYLAQGHAIHWPLSVEQVVALGRLPHHDLQTVWTVHSESDQHVLDQAMRQAGVTHLCGRTVDTLSGGERARVLLARVLAGEPRILLADEPLAGLDPAYQLRIITLLRTLAEQGLAVAVVMHDLLLAARFCHRVLVLHDGQVLAEGTPEAVLNDGHLATAFGIAAQRVVVGDTEAIIPWRVANL